MKTELRLNWKTSNKTLSNSININHISVVSSNIYSNVLFKFFRCECRCCFGLKFSCCILLGGILIAECSVRTAFICRSPINLFRYLMAQLNERISLFKRNLCNCNHNHFKWVDITSWLLSSNGYSGRVNIEMFCYELFKQFASNERLKTFTHCMWDENMRKRKGGRER